MRQMPNREHLSNIDIIQRRKQGFLNKWTEVAHSLPSPFINKDLYVFQHIRGEHMNEKEHGFGSGVG